MARLVSADRKATVTIFTIIMHKKASQNTNQMGYIIMQCMNIMF